MFFNARSSSCYGQNEGHATPIAAGGFLLIGTKDVSVLRLGAFGAVLSPWVEVTRTGLDEMTGSKLNEVMESTQPITEVVRWPQDEENIRDFLIKNATPPLKRIPSNEGTGPEEGTPVGAET